MWVHFMEPTGASEKRRTFDRVTSRLSNMCWSRAGDSSDERTIGPNPAGKGCTVMNGSGHNSYRWTRLSHDRSIRRYRAWGWAVVWACIYGTLAGGQAFGGVGGDASVPGGMPSTAGTVGEDADLVPVAAPLETPSPVSLIGLDAMALTSGGRPRMDPYSGDAYDGSTPFGIPAVTSVGAPRPVTIPFPNAAHLFFPGAALALYAARRMRPRYRRVRGR